MGYIKYTKEMVQEDEDNSTSVAQVMRYLGLVGSGGNATHMRNRINKYGIDTSHFTGQGHNRGKVSPTRKTPEEILVVLPEGSPRQKVALIRRALAEMGVETKCVICGLTDEWQGCKIQLEVDHLDGDWLNNRIENLRYLCPNCHSQCDSSNKPHKYRNMPT